jgi:hypothetical protein
MGLYTVYRLISLSRKLVNILGTTYSAWIQRAKNRFYTHANIKYFIF